MPGSSELETVDKMTNKILGQVLMSAALMVSAVAPAMALDYEAKPVQWVLQAPIRTVGAASGALLSLIHIWIFRRSLCATSGHWQLPVSISWA